MSTVTAAWPLDSLVGALARAGWGVLGDRSQAGQRTVLRALTDLLPHGSAEGKTTAAQVADSAGLSVKHTRTCLHRLEAAGLITWRRGWLDRGRPRPGIIRVVKTALALVIRHARRSGLLDKRRADRADALRSRVQTLRLTTQRPKKQQTPLSAGAELASTPSFHREGPHPKGSAVRPSRKAQQQLMTGNLLCIHGYSDPHNCHNCSAPPPPPATPYQRQFTTRTKERMCRSCSRHRAAHDAMNALVDKSLRHEWHD